MIPQIRGHGSKECACGKRILQQTHMMTLPIMTRRLEMMSWSIL